MWLCSWKYASAVVANLRSSLCTSLRCDLILCNVDETIECGGCTSADVDIAFDLATLPLSPSHDVDLGLLQLRLLELPTLGIDLLR